VSPHGSYRLGQTLEKVDERFRHGMDVVISEFDAGVEILTDTI
jgi:hypothetical protein